MPASSIAPLISGWQRRVGGLPGPYSVAPASGVASGGTGVNGLLVELLIDGTWQDITQRVMVRDSNGQISITRGQTAEGQQPSPGSCSLQLNNRDGLFSPGNPVSPWYGKFGRNTQLRVSVAKGDDKSYRFWGEVTGWPEDWDTTGTDMWVDVEAAGILRRLNQGTTPLRSTMYRGLMSAATTAPVAYWPCEDGASATSLASAVSGPAMALRGTPSLAADTGFACSTALPAMASAALVGSVPSYTVTGQSQVRFLMYLPSSPPDLTQLIKVGATGSIPYWTVNYGTGGSLYLRGYDTDGLTVLVTSGAIAFNVDGGRFRVSMELTQNGPDVNWTLSVEYASNGAVASISNTFAGQTVGRLTSVTVCPGQTITDGVFGHISVQNDVTSAFDLVGQVTAFIGEAPNQRFARLCTEQGVNYASVGLGDSPDKMGPQLPGTFMALLQECVDVDQGVMSERETAFGLAYQHRSSLYNATAALSLSYRGNQLSQVPKPIPDDQTVRNSITATRPGGSSATAELATGPLSVLDPPLGVGTYPDNPTLNVRYDNDLAQHAAWRLHLGTVDEPRYPAISVNLAHPSMAGAQRLAALNTLFGHRIVVQSPPSRLGGDISQIVIGIQETITHFEHRITYVCQPQSPYNVGVRDDTDRGRRDTGGSALVADASPTETALLVATTVGPLWTSSPTDFPQDVMVGGERVTVQAVGQTLNANPSFGTDTSGWSGTSATIARSTTQAHTGTASCLITSGTGSSPRAECTQVAVTAGQQYRAYGWLYAPATLANAEIDINWFNSSHTYLSTSSVVAPPPPGAWQVYDLTATAPATAAYASIAGVITGTPGAGALLYVDDMRLIPVASYSSSPQTMTVTRSVNGVVKTLTAGSAVHVAQPTVRAL